MNGMTENMILQGSVMTEMILGRLVDINGYAANMQRQLESNETLKTSIDILKLDGIDWMSLSPSKLIMLCMTFGLMNTYKDNRMKSLMYTKLPQQKPIVAAAIEVKEEVVKVKEEIPFCPGEKSIKEVVIDNQKLNELNQSFNDI